MSVRFRWRTYLRGATTEQAVVDVVRTYLSAWSGDEIARLPDGVWPLPIMDGGQLLRESLKIGEAHSVFAGPRSSLALLQELLLFMTQASVRATQLRPLPGELPNTDRPVGGRVLSEEEKKLFEAPPAPVGKAVKDAE